MSITRADIKQSAFVEDVKDAEELTLVRKGLVDLGCIAEASRLTSLNLAFNSLVSAAPLASLTGLTSLNLSHNKLAAFGKTLSSLSALTYLNLSHNPVLNVSGVAACTGLQELWLQGTRLGSPADLQPLTALTSLARLVITPSALSKALPPEQLRSTLIAKCSGLQVLDGVQVSDEERQQAAAVMQSEEAVRPGSGPAASTSGQEQDTHTAALSDPGTHSRSSAPDLTDRGSELILGIAPHRHTQGMLGRGRLKGKTNHAPRPPPLPPMPAAGVLSSDPGQYTGRRAESDLASESSSVFSQSQFNDTAMSSATSRQRRRTRESTVPKLRQLPGDSKFQSVLAALPQLTSKLPPEYVPSKLAGTWTRKPQPTAPPPDAGQTVYEKRYAHGSRGVAVRACKDGSVTVQWPSSGDIAITVDADHSHAPPTYRMLAMYRHTCGVAASWDQNGGFIQYPNGTVCMNYSVSTSKTGSGAGSGSLFDTKGNVLLKWTDNNSNPPQGIQPRTTQPSQPQQPAVSVDDTADGAPADTDASHLDTEGDSSPEQHSAPDAVSPQGTGDTVQQSVGPDYVDMALDAHMGVRFVRSRRELQLWFSCEGVSYCAVCGRNDSSGEWTVGGRTVTGEPQPAFCQQLCAGSSAAEFRKHMLQQTHRIEEGAEVLSLDTHDQALANARAMLQRLTAVL